MCIMLSLFHMKLTENLQVSKYFRAVSITFCDRILVFPDYFVTAYSAYYFSDSLS